MTVPEMIALPTIVLIIIGIMFYQLQRRMDVRNFLNRNDKKLQLTHQLVLIKTDILLCFI